MSVRVILSVTSDLVTDQRVHRAAQTLASNDYDVIVVGRKLNNSKDVPDRKYQTQRFHLWFEKGPLFYASYNFRLFWFLLFSKADILLSNDLDTLLPNFLVSKLKALPLVYDSHEYFTGVPELEGRPITKNIWKKIEKFILPSLKNAYTVNYSIAGLYSKEYGTTFHVIRNLPELSTENLPDRQTLRKQLSLPLDKKIIILQGAGINIQRGAEEAVASMNHLDNVLLLIIGGGDVIPALKETVQKQQLQDQVQFVDKLPASELRLYTHAADIGLSLDKDTNLNYRFSLPNKIFDYIHAGIPVLASNLPEVSKIILDYNVGLICPSHDPKEIATCIQRMLTDENLQQTWKTSLKKAAEELNWNSEKSQLLSIFSHLV
ncbi:glycosyltransferase [soil metagenome]